jgi:hypothetical protein
MAGRQEHLQAVGLDAQQPAPPPPRGAESPWPPALKTGTNVVSRQCISAIASRAAQRIGGRDIPDREDAVETGTRNSGVTRTNPRSSSNSGGSQSELGRTRPIAHSTASADAAAWPVLQRIELLVISSPVKSSGMTARCPACRPTPRRVNRFSMRVHTRG